MKIELVQSDIEFSTSPVRNSSDKTYKFRLILEAENSAFLQGTLLQTFSSSLQENRLADPLYSGRGFRMFKGCHRAFCTPCKHYFCLAFCSILLQLSQHFPLTNEGEKKARKTLEEATEKKVSYFLLGEALMCRMKCLWPWRTGPRPRPRPRPSKRPATIVWIHPAMPQENEFVQSLTPPKNSNPFTCQKVEESKQWKKKKIFSYVRSKNTAWEM